MRHGRHILVVVPARGGSKGIRLKNLQLVGGVPLVARVGQLVKALRWVDRAVVSTDHANIAETARQAGLEAPFYRPPELSGDRVGDLEVLTHALGATEELDGQKYDVVVMLQPTSPLRSAEQVTATVDKLLAGGFDSVWTVSPTDSKSHPLKQLTLEGDRLAFYDPAGADIVARQQLGPVYHRNGAAYAFTRECLVEQKTTLGRRASAVVVDGEPMVSIDTLEDLARVDAALEDRRETTPSETSGRKTFVIDIDGVLAMLVPDNDYAKSSPLAENIAQSNALHERGHRIVLFTARGSASGRDWSELTRRQLEVWGVKFDELRFGKPPADYYIDDRSLSLDDAVRLTGVAPSKRGGSRR